MRSSLSRIDINIIIQGKGEAKGELFRHLSPLTLGAMMRKFPIHGRVHRFEETFIYVTSEAVVGVEKARKIFHRNDIAFLSLNSGVCFFKKDCIVAKPMNLLGKVSFGIEVLEQSAVGDIITIEVCS